MAQRKQLTRKGSKRLFTATAKPHRKNLGGYTQAGPMRGGIRL
nr:MAG: hypothetical protein [Microvirus sp.]